MGDFQKWLDIAQRDLESAKILINHHKPAVENTCYLCQQSAEKSLKAYLEFSGEPVPFIHNLAKLCKECQKLEARFQEVNEQSNKLNLYSSLTQKTVLT